MKCRHQCTGVLVGGLAESYVKKHPERGLAAIHNNVEGECGFGWNCAFALTTPNQVGTPLFGPSMLSPCRGIFWFLRGSKISRCCFCRFFAIEVGDYAPGTNGTNSTTFEKSTAAGSASPLGNIVVCDGEYILTGKVCGMNTTLMLNVFNHVHQ